MSRWPLILLVPLLVSCHADTIRGNSDDRTISYTVQITPTQVTLRPNGPGQSYQAKVFEQPSGSPISFRSWSLNPASRYAWEIVGVPQGVDGGRFVFTTSGTLQEAVAAQQIDPEGTTMLQLYYSPPVLPQGTTRLELKIRLTVTPPQGTPLAVGESALIIDANAPALAPDPPNPGMEGVVSAKGQPGS